jgi:hypothetical protein
MTEARTTMIVLTKDRAEQLRYLLNFYKDFVIPIIIVDGSETAFPDRGLHGGVRYVHRPGVDYTTRKNDAVAEVETPYILLRSDRRHVFPGGIKAAADFLDHNPDYGAAHGLYAALNVNADPPTVNPTYDYDDNLGIADDSFASRLLTLWPKYVPSYYAVTRTEIWRKISEIESEFDFDYFFYDELIQAIFSSAFGKIKRLDHLYCVNQPPKTIYTDSEGSMVNALRDSRSHQYSLIVSTVGHMIAEKHSCARSEAEAAVVACLASFIRRVDSKDDEKRFVPKAIDSTRRACGKLLRILKGQTANRRKFRREQFYARLDGPSRSALESFLSTLPPPIPTTR